MQDWKNKAAAALTAVLMAGQASAFLSIGMPVPLNLQAQPLGGKLVTFTWAHRTNLLDEVKGFEVTCTEAVTKDTFEFGCDIATTCPPVSRGILLSAFELAMEDLPLKPKATYSCAISAIGLEDEKFTSSINHIFEVLEDIFEGDDKEPEQEVWVDSPVAESMDGMDLEEIGI